MHFLFVLHSELQICAEIVKCFGHLEKNILTDTVEVGGSVLLLIL